MERFFFLFLLFFCCCRSGTQRPFHFTVWKYPCATRDSRWILWILEILWGCSTGFLWPVSGCDVSDSSGTSSPAPPSTPTHPPHDRFAHSGFRIPGMGLLILSLVTGLAVVSISHAGGSFLFLNSPHRLPNGAARRVGFLFCFFATRFLEREKEFFWTPAVRVHGVEATRRWRHCGSWRVLWGRDLRGRESDSFKVRPMRSRDSCVCLCVCDHRFLTLNDDDGRVERHSHCPPIIPIGRFPHTLLTPRPLPPYLPLHTPPTFRNSFTSCPVVVVVVVVIVIVIWRLRASVSQYSPHWKPKLSLFYNSSVSPTSFPGPP